MLMFFSDVQWIFDFLYYVFSPFIFIFWSTIFTLNIISSWNSTKEPLLICKWWTKPPLPGPWRWAMLKKISSIIAMYWIYKSSVYCIAIRNVTMSSTTHKLSIKCSISMVWNLGLKIIITWEIQVKSYYLRISKNLYIWSFNL